MLALTTHTAPSTRLTEPQISAGSPSGGEEGGAGGAPGGGQEDPEPDPEPVPEHASRVRHVRSVVGVSCASSVSCSRHTVAGVHTRSVVAVGAALS